MLNCYTFLHGQVTPPENPVTDAVQDAGEYSFVWDGKDEVGKKMPTDIYKIKCQAGKQASIRKMLMLNNSITR